MHNNELYHFGIKGQRWGVRRYQNDDGSYTSAGKKRYGRLTKDQQKKVELVRDKLEAERQKLPDFNALENNFFEKNPYASEEQMEKFYNSKEYAEPARKHRELSLDIARLDRGYVRNAALETAGASALFGGILTLGVGKAVSKRVEKNGEQAAKKAIVALGLTTGVSTVMTIANSVKSGKKAKKEQQEAYKKYKIID